MTDNLNRRPGTLGAAIRRYKSGQQTFSVALGEFLDEFYMDRDEASRYARVQESPELLGDDVFDAYAGAVGEHLVRRWHLGKPPDWTEDPCRFLRRPWFPPGVQAEKPILLVESPMAFRRRMLFVEAEPLRRARMPHDDRWRAYEYLRTGMMPDGDGQL
ncbi:MULTISPECIES: hypothetical protein [unclassified Azospirillum]|uniref:hypothetical protein n=1 Tax=unclassified Azospirillum TaxID=2630922 RepID=UPI000D64B3BA|nr:MULTISPECIES: hypothetical protein [unclassified Azospirillum]